MNKMRKTGAVTASPTVSYLALAVSVIVLIAGLFGAFSKAPSADDIASEIRAELPKGVDYNIITDIVRSEVQAKFDGFEAPTYEAPVYDDQKIEDVWKSSYAVEIADLEAESEAKVTDELDEDDIKDFLEEELGISIDEIVSYSIDDDETEIRIINLGLEDEDDREAEVSLEIKVKYTLEEGVEETHRKTILVSGHYFIDNGDEEADLKYSLK